jgi:hypothetical protein
MHGKGGSRDFKISKRGEVHGREANVGKEKKPMGRRGKNRMGGADLAEGYRRVRKGPGGLARRLI